MRIPNKAFVCVSLLIVSYHLSAQKLPNLIPYRLGKLWGYCDSNKNVIISPIYNLGDKLNELNKNIPVFYDSLSQIDIKLATEVVTIDRRGKELRRVKATAYIKPVWEDKEGGVATKTIDEDAEAANDNIDFSKFKAEDMLEYRSRIDGKLYLGFSVDGGTMKLTTKDYTTIYEGYVSIRQLDTSFMLTDTRKKVSIGNRFGKITSITKYDELKITYLYHDIRYKENWGKGIHYDRYMIVKRGIYFGVITSAGREIIPCKKYKKLNVIAETLPGLVHVAVNDRVGFVDYKGIEYWKD